MASGCIPKREDRLNALNHIRTCLAEALRILDEIDDPDVIPRKLEEVSTLISASLGQRADTFIDRSKREGLEDLIEHYFS